MSKIELNMVSKWMNNNTVTVIESTIKELDGLEVGLVNTAKRPDTALNY